MSLTEGESQQTDEEPRPDRKRGMMRVLLGHFAAAVVIALGGAVGTVIADALAKLA